MCRVPSINSWFWRSKRDRWAPDIIFPFVLINFANNDQASDLPTTSRLLITIVTLSKNSGDWGLLNEQVLLLSKKQAQLKQAITRMVQVVMGFLEETPNLDVKLSVIQTLRTVTEGKVSCTTPLIWIHC